MVKKIVLNNAIVLYKKVSWFRIPVISLWLKGGSIYDPPELYGLSHLVEHIISKQLSDSYPLKLFSLTQKEYVGFNIFTLPNYLDKVIKGICRILTQPNFSDNIVTNMQKLVIQEINERKSASNNIDTEFIWETFFREIEYKHSIPGTPETVMQIKKDDCSNYHKNLYTKDRMVFSLVGNVNWKKFDYYIENLLQVPNISPIKDKLIRPLFHTSQKNKLANLKLAPKCEGRITNITFGLLVPPKVDYFKIVFLEKGLKSMVFDSLRDKGLIYSLQDFIYLGKWGGIIAIGFATSKDFYPAITTFIRNFKNFLENTNFTIKILEDLEYEWLRKMERSDVLAANIALEMLNHGRIFDDRPIWLNWKNKITTLKSMIVDFADSIIELSKICFAIYSSIRSPGEEDKIQDTIISQWYD